MTPSSMGTALPTVTDGESLLSYIRRHLDAGGRLAPDGCDLPDETHTDDELRWAPGSMDGILGPHAGPGEIERARNAADAWVKACARPTRRRLRSLHERLIGRDARSIVDLLIDELNRLQPDIRDIRRIALWLASTSPNRGPVKIGLALLGATGLEGHVDVIRTLGAHDEFTLYAAAALQNGLEEPDSELWALAASVDGWGRIHCVERLRNTQDPQIRSWLLREGYKNSIMLEYTALIAADTGGLLAALEQDNVDRALLTTAGELLSALIEEGPAQNIDDYGDGANAIERYLTLMRSRAETLNDYLAVAAIRDFVADDERWEVHRAGWSISRRDAFHGACLEILGQTHWDGGVAAVLTPDAEHGDYYAACSVAHDLGIDTFEASFRRVERDPFCSEWFDVWKGADTTERARRLAELARTRLPLAQIATGPSDALGVGPQFKAHGALDWSLQALRNHPGVGGDLLIVGLQSPVTRNRNMALNALYRWPTELWPPQARTLMEATATGDPSEATRALAGKVLCGEPPD